MKTPVILSFAAGAACGAIGFWLLQPAQPVLSAETKTTAVIAPVKSGAESKGFLHGATAAKDKAGKDQRDVVKSPDSALEAVQKIVGPDSGWREMMRKSAVKDVSREVDRLALRLKLSDEQKEKLRTFLQKRKDLELARMEAAMSGGEAPAMAHEITKDEFLKELLDEAQREELAKAQQEEKTARAEDYAQRKLRRLDRDLNLTPQQEDALFQAFAQRKLAEPGAGTDGDVVAFQAGDAAVGRMSIAIAGSSGVVEPIEIEMPEPLELISGGGGEDRDRPLLEPVLTPEQLAVYDKQRAEAAQQKWDEALPALKTIREVSETVIE